MAGECKARRRKGKDSIAKGSTSKTKESKRKAKQFEAKQSKGKHKEPKPLAVLRSRYHTSSSPDTNRVQFQQ